MSMLRTVYNGIFRNSATFAVVIVGSVFFFERFVDKASVKIFDTINSDKMSSEQVIAKYAALAEQDE